MKLPKPGWPDIRPPPPAQEPAGLLARLLWMAGIWSASIIVLLVLAGLIRLALR